MYKLQDDPYIITAAMELMHQYQYGLRIQPSISVSIYGRVLGSNL